MEPCLRRERNAHIVSAMPGLMTLERGVRHRHIMTLRVGVGQDDSPAAITTVFHRSHGKVLPPRSLERCKGAAPRIPSSSSQDFCVWRVAIDDEERGGNGAGKASVKWREEHLAKIL